ncbi:MAG: UPF0118 membrane protein SCO0513, partial [uncultured Solirubrobacteraceae bacterium]
VPRVRPARTSAAAPLAGIRRGLQLASARHRRRRLRRLAGARLPSRGDPSHRRRVARDGPAAGTRRRAPAPPDTQRRRSGAGDDRCGAGRRRRARGDRAIVRRAARPARGGHPAGHPPTHRAVRGRAFRRHRGRPPGPRRRRHRASQGQQRLPRAERAIRCSARRRDPHRLHHRRAADLLLPQGRREDVEVARGAGGSGASRGVDRARSPDLPCARRLRPGHRVRGAHRCGADRSRTSGDRGPVGAAVDAADLPRCLPAADRRFRGGPGGGAHRAGVQRRGARAARARSDRDRPAGRGQSPLSAAHGRDRPPASRGDPRRPDAGRGARRHRRRLPRRSRGGGRLGARRLHAKRRFDHLARIDRRAAARGEVGM